MEVKTENPLFDVKGSTTPRKDVITKTLPKGFDPASFESYLPEEDYQKLFGISKKEYFNLTLAQRAKLKEESGLF